MRSGVDSVGAHGCTLMPVRISRLKLRGTPPETIDVRLACCLPYKLTLMRANFGFDEQKYGYMRGDYLELHRIHF